VDYFYGAINTKSWRPRGPLSRRHIHAPPCFGAAVNLDTCLHFRPSAVSHAEFESPEIDFPSTCPSKTTSSLDPISSKEPDMWNLPVGSMSPRPAVWPLFLASINVPFWMISTEKPNPWRGCEPSEQFELALPL